MTQNDSIDTVEVKKVYYKSGSLWAESPRVNGKIHGIEKRYYLTGDIYRETPYFDGKKHGIEKEYYESGVLWG